MQAYTGVWSGAQAGSMDRAPVMRSGGVSLYLMQVLVIDYWALGDDARLTSVCHVHRA